MKHQSLRGRSADLANCTYGYALSGSGLCSAIESAAKSGIPFNRNYPDSRLCSIRTQTSIRSIKCQRIRYHHRRKKLSRTQSHTGTSKLHPDQTDEQTDVLCIPPARSGRKLNGSSTRKHAKTARRSTFRGPVPLGIRIVNQILDGLVRAFVGQRHRNQCQVEGRVITRAAT
jgi:hypothetical protein